MKKRGRRKLGFINNFWLMLILIPLLFLDATLLRQDHIKMVELRDNVFLADESENDEEIKQALEELKNFTFSNIVINVVEENGGSRIMFGTGVFYLEHQYIRAANKALEEAEKIIVSDENPHGNIYLEATNICKPQAIENGWAWDNPDYINCMVSEIEKYPAAEELTDKIIAALPSTELYRHNYASPFWVPSLSGWAILLTIMIVVVIFIRIIWWIILRISLLFL